jgi:hypothetical protein
VRRFSRRSCGIAVALVALLLPAGASAAHRTRYLSLASARRAITTYERNYWEGQSMLMRIVGCDRHNTVRVSCTVEANSGEGTRISTTDSATLLPQDIIRVHPGRVEEVLVLQG